MLSVDGKTRGTWLCPPAQTCWHRHILRFFFLLISHYCHFYLWFHKVRKFKLDFKSVLSIRKPLYLEATPAFHWRILPTFLSNTHTTSETKSNQKDQKEQYWWWVKYTLTTNRLLIFESLTYYFLIPFVSELFEHVDLRQLLTPLCHHDLFWSQSICSQINYTAEAALLQVVVSCFWLK